MQWEQFEACFLEWVNIVPAVFVFYNVFCMKELRAHVWYARECYTKRYGECYIRCTFFLLFFFHNQVCAMKTKARMVAVNRFGTTGVICARHIT